MSNQENRREEPRAVFQNDDFWIVEKPPHWLVHPTRPTGERTVLDWLKEQEPERFWALVNRLDRETSGLMLVARSPEAASLLGKLIMRREIAKTYHALVWGEVRSVSGRLEAPLGRLGISETNPIYLKQGVLETGAPAVTEYETEWARSGFSFLRVRLLTGRLHQIRVHLAHMGHPVVGDKLYGPDASLYLKFIDQGWTAEHESKLLLRRHALHASQLEFEWKGEPIRCSIPLAIDLQEWVQRLSAPVN